MIIINSCARCSIVNTLKGVSQNKRKKTDVFYAEFLK